MSRYAPLLFDWLGPLVSAKPAQHEISVELAAVGSDALRHVVGDVEVVLLVVPVLAVEEVSAHASLAGALHPDVLQKLV